MHVGIAWYRPEDYDRLRSMFTDSWRLPDTYDDWLKKAQKASDTLIIQGLFVVKAFIDPETFPEWCRERGMEMDANARMLYGQDYAARH